MVQHPTNQQLLETVVNWLRSNYPGEPGEEVLIRVRGREHPIALLIPNMLANGPIASSAGEAEEEGQPRHSPDFRSVWARGRIFNFSPAQAAIVKALWDAAENETPAVGQEMLLESAGSESKRLRDLFRRGDGTMHPAWGLLIIPAAKGTFRLDLG